MPKIVDVKCHKVVNSRGGWTLETRVYLDDGCVGSYVVPEGASKGGRESVYIPVAEAIGVVTGALGTALHGESPFDQKRIDGIMCDIDGTQDKRNLGGNSILSVSIATAKACASSRKIAEYEYIAQLYGNENFSLPTPLFNVFNGGAHAYNNLSFQEFMIIPAKKLDFDRAYELGVDVYRMLEKELESQKIDTDVGDEGGFAPSGFTANDVLGLLRRVAGAKYKVGDEVFFGCDAAANFFRKYWRYLIHEENLSLNTDGLFEYHEKLLEEYEIIYYEDPFGEHDEAGWKMIMETFGEKMFVVADDLTVTNTRLLKSVLDKKLANAVIVKPNQVGTLTETLDFIRAAKEAGMAIVVSHRSGDSAEDTFISDLAVAVGADFIKAGAPARGERVAKYNRLLGIYYELNGDET